MPHAVTAFPEPPSTPSAGRVYNFSPGPATMPESVLLQLREELFDLFGTGIGLLEQSHRGAAYDRVLAEALESVDACSGLGDDWATIFVPGGSMQQFSIMALNFVPKDGWVAFADTGLWAHKGEHETSCVRTVLR